MILLGLVLSNIALAYPGRTDKYGCHTCRTNCPRWGLSYGKYHCHRSKGLPQPKKQVRSKKLYQLYEKNNGNCRRVSCFTVWGQSSKNRRKKAI